MKNIVLKAIATVKNSRPIPFDDNWGEISSEIELLPSMPSEVFKGIETFSHLEIIYYFDKIPVDDIVYSGRPRGNPVYPEVGIFAQRKKNRPNKIGLCTVELIAHKGRAIVVKNLDAIDGTPILDIKPVYKEFQAVGAIRQPSWVTELMRNYW